MEQDRYISVAEAREMMGVTISKMTRLLKAKELPSKKSVVDKRKKMVRLVDVQKWIEEARKEQAPEKKDRAA